MKRERLTHAQRREQTRERLLEAARKTFVKNGLAATSVADIADAAGYTRGAFYSNFDGKPELLLELVRRDHDSAQVDLRAVMDEGGTPAEVKARAIAYYSRYFRDRDCFLLWVETRIASFGHWLLTGKIAANSRQTSRGYPCITNTFRSAPNPASRISS
jgi:AcrR family transcriptional regulator